MAGIVNEEWTWDVNVKRSGQNEAGVKVIAWDADSDTFKVDELTDAQGNISQQEIQQAVHSITATDTLATDDKTPHVISLVKYGLSPSGVNISFNAARSDTFFLDSDLYITQANKATVDAYTGITVGHDSDTITITENTDLNELYDYAQREAVDSPQKVFPEGIMRTADGNVFQLDYDLNVNTGISFNGEDKTIAFGSGVDATLSGTGTLTDVSITGDLNFGSAATLQDVNVTGTLDFTVAGTYTIDNCNINEVTNSSGGAVTLNLLNGSTITTNTGPSITINNSVSITITCQTSSGTKIEDARVYIEADTGGPLVAGTEIYNDLTDVNGEITTTINYSSDQPIIGRARKATTAPFYKTAPITGTVTTNGFNTILIMIED